jgi:methylated-DNA-[protein]-cysteine S-methyltransferase
VKVPSGKVITYSRLAAMIGRPKAHRAVGTAMNKNPFAPEVPCHRVVKSNGDLGGFGGGSKLKIKRLQEEGVKVQNNKIVNFQSILYKMDID